MPAPPKYGWNGGAARYVDRGSGRFVAEGTVRAGLDTTIEATSDRLLKTTERMVVGKVPLQTWETEMRDQLKLLHLTHTAAARGGWAQLGPSDIKRVEQTLASEYKHLAAFSRQMASGEQPLTGRVVQRVSQYAEAARLTYEVEHRAVNKDAGLTEERNVLGSKDGCSECLGYAASEWQPIGTFKAPGQRLCRGNCRCLLIYRGA